MRKLHISIVSIALLFSLSSPTYAGDINLTEQQILDNMSSAIEYHGKTCHATDEYITKVRNYLIQDDVDR